MKISVHQYKEDNIKWYTYIFEPEKLLNGLYILAIKTKLLGIFNKGDGLGSASYN